MGLPAENIQENAAPKKTRKQSGNTRSAALTVKMPPEALRRIEKSVSEIQSMAKYRAPDKSDVLVWMLTMVKPEDLRKKLDAWNAVFE
jgi:hypothetical protein